jgi:ParB family chromosome partitioning protein
VKRFCDAVAGAGGVTSLNHYPKFDSAPPTVAFDLGSDLEIAGRMRPITEAGIDVQMRSYEKEGEFQPALIRVWPTAGREWKGATHARRPRLIDGAHRLEAAKRLGHKTIMALLVECSEDEARAMEIAANALRTELTPAEKGRQMIEWCRLNRLPVPGEDGGVAVSKAERAAPESADPHASGSRFGGYSPGAPETGKGFPVFRATGSCTVSRNTSPFLTAPRWSISSSR